MYCTRQLALPEKQQKTAATHGLLPTCCRMVCVLGTCLLPDGSLELWSSGWAGWEVAEGGVLM